jgi:hypothetical protein
LSDDWLARDQSLHALRNSTGKPMGRELKLPMAFVLAKAHVLVDALEAALVRI